MTLIRFIKSMCLSLVMLAMVINLFGMETKHERAHKEHKEHPKKSKGRQSPQPLQEMVTPDTIEQNCTKEDFVFLDAYEKIPKGFLGKRGSLRQQALDKLDKKAQEIVQKINQAIAEEMAQGKTEHYQARFKASKKFFDILPEGYLKMKVREYYYTSTKNNGYLDGLPIGTIVERINQAPEVDLSQLGLKSIDGIADLLVIQNEEKPITNLYLLGNNLQTANIPKELTSLECLDISNNKELSELSIPATLTKLEYLLLQANNLESVSIPTTLTALKRLALNHNPLKTLDLPGKLSSELDLVLSNTELSAKDQASLKKRFPNVNFKPF